MEEKLTQRSDLKYWQIGTSLVVQWLRLQATTAGGAGSSLVRELRSCMSCGTAKIIYIYIYISREREAERGK